MKITIYPPLRDQFTMAAMENTMKTRLLELHQNEEFARKAHDEWQRFKPPIHHWTTYLAIARIETYAGLLPSERRKMCETIEFDK
jgi:hypothetical protein